MVDNATPHIGIIDMVANPGESDERTARLISVVVLMAQICVAFTLPSISYIELLTVNRLC
jgi:hypothetical protein